MGMSGYLMEHLLDCYQGEGVFSLNNNEVKIKGSYTWLHPNSINESTFMDRFLLLT